MLNYLDAPRMSEVIYDHVHFNASRSTSNGQNHKIGFVCVFLHMYESMIICLLGISNKRGKANECLFSFSLLACSP